MKKSLKKFTKILVLIAMIFSDLMTPISVLANEITNRDPVKGDVGIDNKVTNNGEMATVSVGSTKEKGGVKVTKTVSKTDTEGRYKIDFKIEGKDDETSTEVPKQVYAVVVFDKSSSMESSYECVEYDWRDCIRTEYNNKWESAVNGAITFAKTLSNKINGAKIALVGFSGDNGYYYDDSEFDDAEIIKINNNTWFSGTELTSDDFGSPIGGTNLQAGLIKANELLSSVADEKAQKYVVVISDGQPTFYYKDNGYTGGNGQTTNKNTYDKTISAATDVKNLGAEIFSIGYMLPAKSEYDYKSAETILTEVSSPDKEGSTFTHYVNADPEKVANAFTNIAEEMSTASAGTNAVLTDNLGGKFTLTTDSTARSYVSETIANITEEGTTLSFYVDIDKDAPTDWYNTNEGFELKYTNAKGEEKTLTCDQNPQVYWVQNTYDYIVNYYKDSFDNNNKITSETRKALNGTVINESNVERDKYLPKGYEFNTIDPASITITNNGEVKEIKILYTIKKFNYIINYYYDEVLNNSKTETNIPYGTRVNSQDYYLKENEIRDGYILDTVKSDNSSYTIIDNTVVINIYYKKNSYEYSVNYFFNNEKGFTNNSEAIYGDKITARSKWLTNEELNAKGKNDYFLDPNKTEENNSEITIGTDSSKNVLDIYYINTNFDNITETISKTTKTNKVISSNDKVSYTVNYNTQINNVRNGDTIVVTITDTLPLKGTIVSKDNRCTFENNTITCTAEYTVNGTLEINEEFNFQVKYSDIKEDKIINSATAKLVLENKEEETTDETETEVYKGTVVATYKTDKGVKLHDDVETIDFAGTNYTTETKSFYGYTLTKVPTNKEGTYVANETIQVDYVYTKNIGTSEEELNKDGIELVGSITDAFDYTITYNTEIKDYVGKATLTITDILPFEIDAEKSEISNNCKYIKENNTILCKYEMDNTPIIINIGNININNNGQIENINKNIIFNIEENFKLYYINVDKKEVTNKVTAELTYGNITKTTDDEHTTEVEEGTVIVNYVTKDGEKLTDSITLTGLVGTTYETVKKEFDKYSFIEVKGEVEGTYTKEQKEITYVYDLTILPPQTGVEANMFMYVNYIFALIALAVAFRTYKTIKNN